MEIRLLDLLFPRLCALCGREGTFLCEQCTELLAQWPGGACAWCSAKDSTSNICGDCATMLDVDELRIGYRYDDPHVARLIHLLKYGNKEALGVDMGKILASRIGTFLRDNDCIVPIPLDIMRHKERGFNQSLCIAQGIARVCGRKVHARLLTRAISRVPQATLGASARWGNMEGVYAIARNQEIPKRVLLVDDVATTGATLRSAIAVLRNAGVENVSALVFAHGTPPESSKGIPSGR